MLTEGIRLTLGGTVFHDMNRLCDNAAGARAALSIGINGCRVDELRVGGVGCDGEESSKGVHCCLGVDEVRGSKDG